MRKWPSWVLGLVAILAVLWLLLQIRFVFGLIGVDSSLGYAFIIALAIGRWVRNKVRTIQKKLPDWSY